MKDYKEKGEKDLNLQKFLKLLQAHSENIINNRKTNDKRIKQKYDWCKGHAGKVSYRNEAKGFNGANAGKRRRHQSSGAFPVRGSKTPCIRL